MFSFIPLWVIDEGKCVYSTLTRKKKNIERMVKHGKPVLYLIFSSVVSASDPS